MCDECKKRPATVHVTRVVGGEKSEAHLCAPCAQERGEMGFMAQPGITFQNILAGLFDPGGLLANPKAPAARPKVRCSNCGLSFSDFRRLGQLGCSECYVQFESDLEPLIRRIHGSTSHVGKRPHKQNGAGRLRHEIENLRQELQQAIAKEEYERAAQLRDRMRELEQKVSRSDT